MPKISQYADVSQTDSPDLLVVVDVDDTTMSPEGTTKKSLLSQLTNTQSVTLTATSGTFTVRPVIRLLEADFSAAGRLRLYNSAAARAADLSRPAGALPTTTGVLYEYVADTDNTDDQVITLYPGPAATVYYQLDDGPTVIVTWFQDVS